MSKDTGVISPGWGISAKVGTGVSELLDIILLLAEIEDLKGDLNKPAEGVIIESRLDPKRGITATLVITDGTLKRGMFVVAEGHSLLSVLSKILRESQLMRRHSHPPSA